MPRDAARATRSVPASGGSTRGSELPVLRAVKCSVEQRASAGRGARPGAPPSSKQPRRGAPTHGQSSSGRVTRAWLRTTMARRWFGLPESAVGTATIVDEESTHERYAAPRKTSARQQPRCDMSGSSLSRRTWAACQRGSRPGEGPSSAMPANVAAPHASPGLSQKTIRTASQMVWFQCEGCGDTLKKARPAAWPLATVTDQY